MSKPKPRAWRLIHRKRDNAIAASGSESDVSSPQGPSTNDGIRPNSRTSEVSSVLDGHKAGQMSLPTSDTTTAITTSASPVADLDALSSSQREKALAEFIEERLQTVKHKQWKFSLDKTEIVAAEQVNSIVEKILFAKDFISQAARNEPHAALAWAGVSMLLPLVLNHMTQDKAATKGLESIADLILRYRVIDKTYRAPDNWLSMTTNQALIDLRSALEEKIIVLYVQTLEFQLRMFKHYSHGTGTRVLRDLVFSDDWGGMLSVFAASNTAVQSDLKAIDSACLHEGSKDMKNCLRLGFEDQMIALRNMTANTKHHFEMLQNGIEFLRQDSLARTEPSHAKTRRKLLQTLSSDYSSLKKVSDEKEPGTCKWFLDHPKFSAWESSPTSSLLMLSAGPGCGKSVLMRSRVDNKIPPVRSVRDTDITTYFFFRDIGKIGESSKGLGSASATQALAAILHQIFCVTNSKIEFSELAAATWNNHGRHLTENFSAMWDLLVKCGEHSRIVCIIDALNECERVSRTLLIDALSEYYCDHPNSQLGLHFLVSNRRYSSAEYQFEKLAASGDSRIVIEDELLGGETELVISARVHRLERLSKAMQEYLIGRLLELQTDSRTYLWLKLLFDGLMYDLDLENADESDIEQALKSVPKDLYDAYEQILDRSKDRAKSRRLLSIILGAFKPLTVKELQVAYSLESAPIKSPFKRLHRLEDSTFKEVASNLCGLFVVFVDGKAYLIHQTAREFLFTNVSHQHRKIQDYAAQNSSATHSYLPWRHSFHVRDIHYLFSQICIFLQVHPTLCRAVQDILAHAAKSQGQGLENESKKHFQKIGKEVDALECEYPLLPYSATNWRSHLRVALHFDRDRILYPVPIESSKPLIEQICDTSNTSFWSWFLCNWASNPFSGPKEHTRYSVDTTEETLAVYAWIHFKQSCLDDFELDDSLKSLSICRRVFYSETEHNVVSLRASGDLHGLSAFLGKIGWKYVDNRIQIRNAAGGDNSAMQKLLEDAYGWQVALNIVANIRWAWPDLEAADQLLWQDFLVYLLEACMIANPELESGKISAFRSGLQIQRLREIFTVSGRCTYWSRGVEESDSSSQISSASLLYSVHLGLEGLLKALLEYGAGTRFSFANGEITLLEWAGKNEEIRKILIRHDPELKELGPLSRGWEMRFTSTNREYFVDNNTKSTAWYAPRVPASSQTGLNQSRQGLSSLLEVVRKIQDFSDPDPFKFANIDDERFKQAICSLSSYRLQSNFPRMQHEPPVLETKPTCMAPP